ncbi:MAG TPA: pyruvate formate lyase activating enzyme, partial [Thermoplasmata archaeon]
TPDQLAAMAWQLRSEGCHNINWVGGEPTIHLHTIIEAISLLDSPPGSDDLSHAQGAKSDATFRFRRAPEEATYEDEFNAPMLWNSNFFMSEETMRILRPLIDVWLPDFKFGNDKCAIFLSRTPWYFDTVARNHKLVYDWGEDLVIRHLVMPNHVECCTRPVLEWIAEHTPQALVNVMDQYHPDSACDRYSPQYDPRNKELSRMPYAGEIERAYEYASELGLRWKDVTLEKSVLGLWAPEQE